MRTIARLARLLAAGTLGSTLLPLRADVVTDWNAALTEVFEQPLAGAPLHQQVRTYATLHLAIHSAIISARHGDRELADEAATVAAFAAGRVVWDRLLAGVESAPPTPAPPDARRQNWWERGRSRAESVLQLRMRDRWPAARAYPTGRASAAELLLPLESTGAPSMAWAGWNLARPFAVRRAVQFMPEPPYWVFADGEVMPNNLVHRKPRLFGGGDAVDRSSSALAEWRANPCTRWNRLATALARARAEGVPARAEWFTLLNAALADALLVAAYWSDHYASVRNEAPVDWWSRPRMPAVHGLEPPTTAPWLGAPIRGYPATGAVLAGAAERVLVRIFGDARVPRAPADTPADRPADPAEWYPSITAAARECAVAHHFDHPWGREACIAGYELGLEIGDYVTTRGKRALLTPSTR